MNEGEKGFGRLDRRQSRMLEFIESGIERSPNSVKNFIIQGDFYPERGQADPKFYIVYFPKSHDTHILIPTDHHRLDVNLYCKKILDLKVPQNVQARVADNINHRRALEITAESKGYPSLALVFAKQDLSREEIVALFAIKGVSPRTGLLEIQNSLRRKMGRPN